MKKKTALKSVVAAGLVGIGIATGGSAPVQQVANNQAVVEQVADAPIVQKPTPEMERARADAMRRNAPKEPQVIEDQQVRFVRAGGRLYQLSEEDYKNLEKDGDGSEIARVGKLVDQSENARDNNDDGIGMDDGRGNSEKTPMPEHERLERENSRHVPPRPENDINR